MSKTKAWEEYEQGIDYKNRIGLYSTVDLNERFFAGDQWVGIPHEGLPTPVVNFIKYASAWKIAAVTDRRLELRFFAEGQDDGGDIGTYATQISDYCDLLWERLKMDYLTKEGLKQAAIAGDYIQYFYWDDEIGTGQSLTGDINTMLIDNVNYYPGNPNDPDVQRQPYIILAFRELVSKVREEAEANGCKHIERIVSDDDTEYTSGDRGKIELDDAGKCNVLLKMYKKDGHVYCEKSVRDVVIQEEKDTQLTRYPIALMNWETRKNCCHGMAEVTGLIPNQVFVNKILALSQLNQVQTSFPKVIYDKTRIQQWSNKVAGAIPVNGDIGGAARYMNPPAMSYDAWRGLDVTIDKTMRMMGANDVTLGNISNPDNTSAFIATRDAAMVPLQSQQERFYAFIEDVGLIWLDFIQNFYKTGRKIPVEHEGERIFVTLPDDALDEFTMRLKVDVGPSSMWSETQVLHTLDNLLARGQITFKQYLERIPDGHIPDKEGLLAEVKAAEEQGSGGMPPGMGGMPPEMGAPAGNVMAIVQQMAEAGEVPPEVAQVIMELAQKGAGPDEMMQALTLAVENGLMSEEVMASLMEAISGGSQEMPMEGMSQDNAEPLPEGMPPVPEEQMAQEAQSAQGAKSISEPKAIPNGGGDIGAVLQRLIEADEIPMDVAEAITLLAEEGASPDVIMEAVVKAAEQGMISDAAVQEIARIVGGEV